MTLKCWVEIIRVRWSRTSRAVGLVAVCATALSAQSFEGIADRYRKTDEGWRIAHTGYTRVFEEHRTHTTLQVRSFRSRWDAPG